MDLDLNIQNYTNNDLINFFQLNGHYTKDDLDSKEKEISLSVISSNKKSYTPEYKNNMLEFVKQAKQVLLNALSGLGIETQQSELQMQKIDTQYTSNPLASTPYSSSLGSIEPFGSAFLNKRLQTTDVDDSENQNKHDEGNDYHINNKGEFVLARTLANNVGKVINPMSAYPVIQTNNILPNGINGYNVTTTTKNYVFNTRYRSDYFTTSPSDCAFILPTKLKNVMSITLSALQFPNVIFAFDAAAGTNTMVIREDVTENVGIVVIPSGNYTIDTYQQVLEVAINKAVMGYYDPADAHFKVYNDPYTHFTTISNRYGYTFTMDIAYKLDIQDRIPVNNVSYETALETCRKNYYINPNIYDEKADLKSSITPADIYTTMGYLLGYRKPIYSGSTSYTSESQFNSILTNYVYFCLDDYNKNNFTTTYGILPNSVIDENILGVVAITSPTFSNTFDSGANFIYKTRHYTAPVDINRIRIKMLNTFGATVNLFENDFAFCLEVETLYDNLKPPAQTEIRITQ
jgi:hypothetical protein